MSKEKTTGMGQETVDKYQSKEQDALPKENVSAGMLLRQRRKEKGLSIRDVAKETNISSSNLVGIEHEDYNSLPADTFIRGQIAIYGNYLGLDGTEVARSFLKDRDRQRTDKKKSRFSREEDAMSAKRLAEPAHISSAALAGLLFLLLVLIATAFCLYTKWNPFASVLHREQQAAPVHAAASDSTANN